MLEEQAVKKTVEAVVFVKSTRYSANDDIFSSDEGKKNSKNVNYANISLEKYTLLT